MAARVAHLTTVHSAHDARILYKECRALAAAGYEVSLIAPHDRDEVVDGVAIRRLEPCRNRWERVTRTARQALSAALEVDADAYHFHDPELIPVGWVLKRRGKRVIYDVHEEVPKQIVSKEWIPRPLRHGVARAAGAVERWAAGWLDGVVAATPVIAAGFPAEKTVTVNNYPVLNAAQPAAGRWKGTDGAPVVAYVGNITRERGIFELMHAVALLADRFGVRLELAGKFVTPELEEEARRDPAWRCVDFHGWCSRDEVWRLLSRATLGAVPLHPLQRYIDSQPVKMYEYMAAGLPVVASDFPLWREVITSAGCGVLAEPKNAERLADAIARVIRDPEAAAAMGRRGRAAVEECYNWGVESNRLVEFYQRLIGPTPRAAEALGGQRGVAPVAGVA